MWGLEHQAGGPMFPPEDCELLRLSQFPPDQREEIIDRLEEVADRRLEEKQHRWNWFSFHWQAFWADPQGIFIDTLGYKPWRLPFRMGRLTAAAAASVLMLLLGAEAWEIGVSFSVVSLLVGALGSIVIATLFIFFGQNLGEISREFGWREQLARTRLVLFNTLLGGMAALWLVLFLVAYLAVWLVPPGVPAGWLGLTLDAYLMVRHAAFIATLGVLAAALGGNLEDEDELKAEMFYDEET